MADLKTNYVDDVLDSDKNQFRKYQMIYNDDGTVSFVDVTTYTQNGDSFGAKDINDTNAAVNELNSNLIKHKFITPSGDTVTDNCIKTATRISVSIYNNAGVRQTNELFADGDSNYNIVEMYVNNEWFQGVFSVNKTTGTITRTDSSELKLVLIISNKFLFKFKSPKVSFKKS